MLHYNITCIKRLLNQTLPDHEPDAHFSPMNLNFRLNNIFSYYHLSERNSKWNSDHWLVSIKLNCVPTEDEDEIDELFVKLLTEVVGSETDAKSKIYIIWCKTPFGFGAEVDEETANKLKGLPDVLLVLPDYGFDVNKRNSGALVISCKPLLPLLESCTTSVTHRRLSCLDVVFHLSYLRGLYATHFVRCLLAFLKVVG
ncbi:hypothetical protein ACHQM5_007903 [Ranunculus cassubicifolius]